MIRVKDIWAKYAYVIIYTLLAVLIGGICLHSINEVKRIVIIDDQFAYWGIAAQLAGYDWSDMMSVTGYYSYGYSLILIPLYLFGRLGMNAVVMYRVAVLINAIFLILSFKMTVYVGQKIFPQLNKYYLLLISAVCTLYISNIAQAASAWTETCLYFMFWCVTVCVYRALEKPTIINFLLLCLAVAYIFMVHMRALGVVIAAALILFLFLLMNHKQVPVKQIVITIVAAVLLLFITIAIKEYITADMYQNNARLSTNDFSGQSGSLKRTLSLTGFVDLALSFLGKLFYLGVSSYLVVFIAFLVMINKLFKVLIQALKEKKIIMTVREYFLFFLVLSFLGEVGICAMFKIFPYYSLGANYSAADTIMFGRYTDFIIGPMLLIGFAILPEIYKYIKEVLFSMVVLFISAIAVQHQLNIMLEYNDPAGVAPRPNSVMGIYYLFNGDCYNFAFYVAGIVILLFAVLHFIIMLNHQKKGYGCAVVFGVLVIGSIWVTQGVKGMHNIIDDKINKEKHSQSVADLVKYTNPDTEIYYITDGDAQSDVKILQWTCFDRPIHIVTLEEINDKCTGDEILYISNSDDPKLTGILSDRKEYIYNSGTLSVYVEPGSQAEADVISGIADIRNKPNPKWAEVDLGGMLTDLSYRKYNGNIYFNYNKDEGYLTQQTHLTLGDGLYEFVIQMEIGEYNGTDEIGYITVTNMEGSYLDTKILSVDDFNKNGKGKITVQIEVKNFEEPVIGVYTYTNCTMKVCDVKYRQIKGNIKVGEGKADTFKEFSGIINDVDKDGQYDIAYVDSDSSGATSFPDLSEIEDSINKKVKYIPGEIMPYKETVYDAWMIIEKGERVEEVFALLPDYKIMAEGQGFYLVITGSIK